MEIGGLNIQNVGSGVSLATLLHIKSGAGAGAAHDNLVCSKSGTETLSIDVNGLMTATSGDKYQYAQCNIGDIVADSDAIVPCIFYAVAGLTLVSIGLSVDTDIGDDDVNYQTIQFTDEDDNAILASAFTTDVAWTAGVIVSAGSLVSASHEVLVATDYVKMTFTKTSSGLAMSGLTAHIAFEYTS